MNVPSQSIPTFISSAGNKSFVQDLSDLIVTMAALCANGDGLPFESLSQYLG